MQTIVRYSGPTALTGFALLVLQSSAIQLRQCYDDLHYMNDSMRSVRDLRTWRYLIKDGYSVRTTVPYFMDVLAETENIIHQPEVYPFAARILRAMSGNTVVDLGCGRAKKLVALHPEFDIIGVDYGENLRWCENQYLFGRWIEHDFEHGQLLASKDWNLKGAGVICSDTIEHLVHPEFLLETISEWLEYASFALFSTPERDLTRGTSDMGPPANPHHVREWNLSEFSELLKHSGMDLWASGLTVNNTRDLQKKTTLALARRSGWKAAQPADDFRVLAVICTYNEADIIGHTLHYLTNQGIRVVMIDNWSTDETVGKAQPFLDKGLLRIERFPKAGPSATYNWHNLLSRVEDIALEATTDWVIHHDADEIRQGPWSDLTLKESLYQVDREGYNCVDHVCIIFHPTPESEFSGGNIPDAFRYFEFAQHPGYLLQRKAWKKQPDRVNLADSGGHDVCFVGRRVYPLRFLLKHYPIRSQEHGRRKVFEERVPRYNPLERQERGWHVHYDGLPRNRSFLREPRDLIFFDSNRFEAEYLCERLA